MSINFKSYYGSFSHFTLIPYIKLGSIIQLFVLVMEWRSVPEFEGLYLINRKGIVKSVCKLKNASKSIQIISGRNLAQHKTKAGYYQVHLYKEGKSYTKQVHRLVAAAFISNPNLLPMVNHRNSNPGDNRASNLEWCDALGNVEHAIKVRRMKSRKVTNRCLGTKLISLAQFAREFKVPYNLARQEIVRLNTDCPCWKIVS